MSPCPLPAQSPPRPRTTWACAALALALSACAVGPDFERAPPPDVARYSGSPDASATSGDARVPAQRLQAGMDIPAQWWTLFRSPVLDTLVRQALDNSPTLAQARATLQQARETLRAETGARTLPAADAGVSAARQKVDPSAYGVPVAELPPPFTLYNASVEVSYTLDFFGANRRALEGLQAQVDYQRHEMQGVRMMLAGNVVTTAIQLAGLQARLDANRSLLQAQARQFDILRARQQAGGVSALEVRRQATLLAQTRATLPPLEEELDRSRHQLAVYLGQMPSQATLPDLSLDELQLPLDVPLGVPSMLVRQRPDILAAEALWQRASADVGVATANRYPRFTLTGSFGSQRTRAGEVADGVNVWSLALGLTQPLFRGGELLGRQRAAEAALQGAAAAYRDTVLQGFQQVANALRAVHADADTLQAATDADQHAEEAYRITERLYRAGGVSQLALLDAQRELWRTRAVRIQAQADRYADTAALLQALGGGWWNEPLAVSSLQSVDPDSCHACLLQSHPPR